MGNYELLKAAINEVIKANGRQEITGEVLNQVLLSMVNSLGAGYQCMGVATPSTNPGTPDQNVFYFATQAGTYTNFGAIVLQAGISVLIWDGDWVSQTWFTVDSAPTNNSQNLIASGAVFNALKLDGGAYDVSAHNSGVTFASLSELLNSANLNTLIPTEIRHGGMSIKFVQSSDNKYVQFRYMSSSTAVADFTDVANWQKEDNGVFCQVTVTNNSDINAIIKEALIKTVKYQAQSYTVDDITLIGVMKAQLIGSTYYSGILLRVGSNVYIANYRTFSNQQDALNDCTTHYVFGDNEYIVDWSKLDIGEPFNRDCSVSKYVADINYWSYLCNLKNNEKFVGLNTAFPITNNNEFNKMVKEMYIASDIDATQIIAIGIHKAKYYAPTNKYFTGISIGLLGGTWVTRYKTFDTEAAALAACTSVFEDNGDYFLIDWASLPQGGQDFNSISVKSIVKDINYAPAIQMYIATPTFAITNNFKLNKIVKEMYLGSTLDAAQIKTISIIKNFVSGANHLTGFSIQLNDDSWVARYKIFNTSEDAIAAATPIFVVKGDYFIVDWSLVDNSNAYYNLIINPNVKNIDFSPSIKSHLSQRTVINITDGSTFISEMERAFALGNCEVNISVGTLDLSSLAEQYWNNDQYGMRGRFCQIGNGCKYNFSSNTKIVCNYTGSEIMLMRNFSIFNADGKDFELNGLIAEGSKLRYIIHDDPNNKDDVNGYTHIYNNCQLKLDNTNVPDVAANNNYYDTIGGGIGSNTTIIVRGGTYHSIPNGHQTYQVHDFGFHGYYYDHDYLSRVIVENVWLANTVVAGKIAGQEQYGEIEFIVNNCSMSRDVTNDGLYTATIKKWNNEIR